MTIEDELIAFLESQISERASPTKARNIEMVAFLYGFGDSPWPTLEETAQKFSIKKQRVSQIIKSQFRSVVSPSDIPSVQGFHEIVVGNRFWSQSDLETRIVKSKLVGDNFSIRGLFNLMNGIEGYNAFDIYTPEMQRVTRSLLGKFEEYFIVRKSDVGEIKSLFQKAKKLPGKCGGIGRIDYLKEERDYDAYVGLIEGLVSHSESTWTKYEQGRLWYLFEDRDNILINYGEKVFSVIDRCEVDRLAQAYDNALRGRTYKYDCPPVELITDYLRSSKYIENIDNTVSFAGQTASLNKIEEDVVEYLKSYGETAFPNIRAHLSSKGHKKDYVVKAAYHSPFIHVDKSLGYDNYKFGLVGSLKESSNEGVEIHARYQKFLRRLRRISDTDETVEQKIRKEQRILREWLFEDKDLENCALCNNRYTVPALRTAHKKRRAECNEAERLDPYIVMPVCVFGCDFLYENRHVVVKKGVVTNGLPLDNAEIENKYIQKLIGRKVDEEWLKGQVNYFQPTEIY